MNISEIRAKYPQYDNLSDQELADGLHQKYYSDLPKDDFYGRIGMAQAAAAPAQVEQEEAPPPAPVRREPRLPASVRGESPVADRQLANEKIIREQLPEVEYSPLGDTFADIPEHVEGLPNLAKGAVQTGVNMVGGLAQSAADIGRNMETVLPLGGIVEDPNSPLGVSYLGPDEYRKAEPRDVLDETADKLSNYKIYEPENTPETITEKWEQDDFLGAAGETLGYAFETGVTSLPAMAAAVANLPLGSLAMGGNIAQKRAENQGMEQPGGLDTLIGQAAGTASMATEKLATERIFGKSLAGDTLLKRLLQGFGTEATQEAIQGSIEYAGETAGTGEFSLPEMGKQAFWGALAGGPFGSAISGVEHGLGRFSEYANNTDALEVLANEYGILTEQVAAAEAEGDTKKAASLAKEAEARLVQGRKLLGVAKGGAEGGMRPLDVDENPQEPGMRPLDVNPNALLPEGEPDQLGAAFEQAAAQPPVPMPVETGVAPVLQPADNAPGSAQPGSAPAAQVAQPSPEGGAEPRPPVLYRGNPSSKVSTARGRSVDTDWDIYEAEELITSDNEAYPQELQPRDRGERAASGQQVDQIAGNLDPTRLGESAEADRGAPIVGPDGIVESGNGRIMAIRQAYAEDGEAADRYRSWVSDELGIEASELGENPILVRRRTTEMTPEERQAFAIEANEQATMQLSDVERANADAALIKTDLLDLLDTSKDITSPDNSRFVKAFLQGVNQADLNQFSDGRGGLSQSGVRRIRGALLAKAYGGTDQSNTVLGRMLESTDDNTRQIGNALVDVAPEFSRLRDKYAGHKWWDVTKNIVDAVQIANEIRNKGGSAKDWLDQVDMFDAPDLVTQSILKTFYNNKLNRVASRERIATALRYYAEEAGKQEGDMFFDENTVTPEDLIDEGKRRAQPEAEQGRPPQTGGAGTGVAPGGQGDGRPRPAGEGGGAGAAAEGRPGEQGAGASGQGENTATEGRAETQTQDKGLSDEVWSRLEQLADEDTRGATEIGGNTFVRWDGETSDAEDAAVSAMPEKSIVYLEKGGKSYAWVIDRAEVDMRTRRVNAAPAEAPTQFGYDNPDEAVWPDVETVNFTNDLKGGPFIEQSEADAQIEQWKSYAHHISQTEDHSKDIIISLFDHTGEWSAPYKAAGYKVIQYDIKDGADILEQSPGAFSPEIIEGEYGEGHRVVGILSAPPCTTFASSGSQWWNTRHNNPKWVEDMWGLSKNADVFDSPHEFSVTLIHFLNEIIDQAKPVFHAMENPIGRLKGEMNIHDPAMRFMPHNFGDPYTKNTNLWGVMSTDLPTANVEPTEASKMHKMSSADEKIYGARSETPAGFAYAFFVANNVNEAKFTGEEPVADTPDNPQFLKAEARNIWYEATGYYKNNITEGIKNLRANNPEDLELLQGHAEDLGVSTEPKGIKNRITVAGRAMAQLATDYVDEVAAGAYNIIYSGTVQESVEQSGLVEALRSLGRKDDGSGLDSYLQRITGDKTAHKGKEDGEIATEVATRAFEWFKKASKVEQQRIKEKYGKENLAREDALDVLTAKSGNVISEAESPDGNRYSVGNTGAAWRASVGTEDGWSDIPELDKDFSTKEQAAEALVEHLYGPEKNEFEVNDITTIERAKPGDEPRYVQLDTRDRQKYLVPYEGYAQPNESGVYEDENTLTFPAPKTGGVEVVVRTAEVGPDMWAYSTKIYAGDGGSQGPITAKETDTLHPSRAEAEAAGLRAASNSVARFMKGDKSKATQAALKKADEWIERQILERHAEPEPAAAPEAKVIPARNMLEPNGLTKAQQKLWGRAINNDLDSLTGDEQAAVFESKAYGKYYLTPVRGSEIRSGHAMEDKGHGKVFTIQPVGYFFGIPKVETEAAPEPAPTTKPEPKNESVVERVATEAFGQRQAKGFRQLAEAVPVELDAFLDDLSQFYEPEGSYQDLEDAINRLDQSTRDNISAAMGAPGSQGYEIVEYLIEITGESGVFGEPDYDTDSLPSTLSSTAGAKTGREPTGSKRRTPAPGMKGDEGDKAISNSGRRRIKRITKRVEAQRKAPDTPQRKGSQPFSIYEEMFTELAGGSETNLAMLKTMDITRQLEWAIRMMKSRYGFKDIALDPKQAPVEQMSILNDAYRNLRNLAAITGIRDEAVGFEGNLILSLKSRLDKAGNTRGVFQWSWKEGFEASVIGLSRRADSFAHEWGHALDIYLQMYQSMIRQPDGSYKFDPDTLKIKRSKEEAGIHAIGASGQTQKGMSPRREVGYKIDNAMKKIIGTLFFTEDPTPIINAIRQSQRLNAEAETAQKELNKVNRSLDARRKERDKAEASLRRYRENLNTAEKKAAKAGHDTKTYADARASIDFNASEIDRFIPKVRDAKAAVAKLEKQQDALERQIADNQAEAKELKKSSNKMLKKWSSEFAKGSKYADKLTGGDYFSAATEMFARAFESYIGNKIRTQSGAEFLAGSKSHYNEGADAQAPFASNTEALMSLIYPKEVDRARIEQAFDELFLELGDARVFGTPHWGRDLTEPQDMARIDVEVHQRLAENGQDSGARKAWDAMKKDFGVSRRAAAGLYNAMKKIGNAPTKISEAVKLAQRESLARALNHAASATFLATARGRMLGLIAKYDSTPAIKNELRKILRKIATDPGSGLWQPRTIEEDQALLFKQSMGELTKAAEAFGIDDSNKEQMDLLHEVLTRPYEGQIPVAEGMVREAEAILEEARAIAEKFPKNKGNIKRLNQARANLNHKKAYLAEIQRNLASLNERVEEAGDDFAKFAQAARRILDTHWQLADQAGINLGYTKNGYLPRILDTVKIENDRTGFLKAAEAAYEDWRMTAGYEKRQEIEKLEANRDSLKRNTPQRAAAHAKLEKAQGELQFLENFDTREAAEDWLYSIGATEFFNADKATPPKTFAKRRTLPPSADVILKEYMMDNPIHAMHSYFQASSRRIAYAKRFGANNEKLEIHRHELRTLGMSEDDIQYGVDEAVRIAVGAYRPTMGRGLGYGPASWAFHLGNGAMLVKTLFVSIMEPLVAGMRTGDVRDSFRAMALVAADLFNSPDARTRREVAEYLGITGDILSDQIMHNKMLMMDTDSAKASKVMGSLFKSIGVFGYTQASRRAAAGISHKYMATWADRYLTGSPDEKAAAKEIFAELGVSSTEVDAFAKWMYDLPGNPAVSDLHSPEERELVSLYATAINRFTDQTIMNPTNVDRPVVAFNPIGRFLASLMSFNYAFQRNVLIRHAKNTKREGLSTGQFNMQLAWAGSFGLLMAGQLMMQLLRDAWSDWPWDDESRLTRRIDGWVEDPSSVFWNGVSRAGGFGAFDPLYQVATGFKYNRPLSQTMIGAVPGYYAGHLDDILAGIADESATNTAEFKAWKSLYELSVGATLPFVADKIGPSGFLTWAFLTKATGPDVSETFASFMAGGPKGTKTEGSKSGGGSARGAGR